MTRFHDTVSHKIPPRRGRGPIWLLHLIAALILGVCFLYGATVYDSLPRSVPSHWGAGGRPDAWSPKTFSSVFSPLMVSAAINVLLLLVSAAVPAMVPPDKDATDWSLYGREGMLRGTIAVLGGTSILTAIMIGYLCVAGWTNPEHVPLWPAVMTTALIFALIPVAFTAASRWSRRTALRRGITPTAAEQKEEKLWIAGFLYNNPDDPDIWVPKRTGTGTGFTLNIGNTKGRTATIIFLAVFVALPLIFGLISAL